MEIIYKEKIDSTNNYGKTNIDILKDKSVIYSVCQTAGRGRLDRKWMSFDSQNLFASIILKPEGDFSKLPVSNLTQLLSVIIVDVLSKYKIIANIKWPNDIIILKSEDDIFGEKICGILAEVVTFANRIKGIVLGFGLNINATKKELSSIDRPATSMFNETCSNFVVKDILLEIINMFFLRYDEFMDKGFDLIREEYLSKIKFIGNKITVNMPHKSVDGLAETITNDGGILLNTGDNKIIITIGEII